MKTRTFKYNNNIDKIGSDASPPYVAGSVLSV